MALPLLIRADADTRMGTGHVMRCLALAQGWRKTGPVTFALAHCPPALEARLRAEGFELEKLAVDPGSLEDARASIALAAQLGAGWIVVDGYQFGADYQRAIKHAGRRLLFLDDNGHAGDYCADDVLNQNLHARPGLYLRREPGTHLLLGPRYALLRQQFLTYRDWRREHPAVARNVLVTLGGTDADNVTGRVIAALRGLDVAAKIVVGGSNPHREALGVQVGSLERVELVVDAANMPDLMAWADVAVAAAGGTSLELAFMGLPVLWLVLADNQAAGATALDRAGAGVNLGDQRGVTTEALAATLGSLLSNGSQRAQCSRRGRELVDGLGVSRVLARLRAADLRLRPASESDCRRVWEWANDPAVRAVSFTSDPIPWASHVEWFGGRLQDAACHYRILEDQQGAAIGQIRFEQSGATATVSVSLDRVVRGGGLGAAGIVCGTEDLFARTPVSLVHAYIKPDNLASVRAFEAAGFTCAGPTTVRGQPGLHFTLQREEP
jgi:UDP-2,4-diacetamido-2,4,6-trideoxy-beta-L-altropyranose hydrolase